MKCVALILVCIAFHLQQGVGPFRVKRRGVSSCPSFVLHRRKTNRGGGSIANRGGGSITIGGGGSLTNRGGGSLTNRSHNSKAFLWGYPIYDDSPFKLRRPKIYPNFEYGELRKAQDFDYVISTNLAQKNYKIPDVGYLYNVDEMGTGRTDDVHTPIDMVFGERDVDPNEVERIKAVLNIFDQGNGMGICTLMGAKRAHFAFKYNGYLSHFHGIKNYLRFLINKHYPGAKVTLISEHWIDAIDESVCVRHSNIPFSKIGHQRRLIFNKYDYIYENDKNRRIYKAENRSNVWAFHDDPQMLT